MICAEDKMLKTKTVEIYGDSIMKGTLLDAQTQRYRFSSDQFIKPLEEQFSIGVVNCSRFGCTIQKGSRILFSHIQKGMSCDAAVLEYGGNDCDFNWDEVAQKPEEAHDPHTPITVFENIYKDMIAKLKEINIMPVIMSLPPLNAERYLSWITRNGLSRINIIKWLGDVQMIYRTQELYSQAVTKIAYETKCVYVDVRSRFLGEHGLNDLLCADGIHPNEKGYALICRSFTEFAAELV